MPSFTYQQPSPKNPAILVIVLILLGNRRCSNTFLPVLAVSFHGDQQVQPNFPTTSTPLGSAISKYTLTHSAHNDGLPGTNDCVNRIQVFEYLNLWTRLSLQTTVAYKATTNIVGLKNHSDVLTSSNTLLPIL